jgi:hypothetical protein
MKTIVLATAAALALASVAPLHAQSQDDCMSMLTLAVGNALDAQGFDTSRICELTVAQLAQIKSMIEEDGMNNASRQAIEGILADAG